MKINKKALLLGTMAFVLVAASGMVSAYASGSSGNKEGKGTDNYRGCVHWQCGCRRYDKGRSKKAVDAYVDSIKDTSFFIKGCK